MEISIENICNWARDLEPKVDTEADEIKFLKAFSSNPNYQPLIEEDATNEEEIYQLPVAAYDPVMIFFFFMQNITGSTHFRVLSYDLSKESCHKNQGIDVGSGEAFYFDKREFSLLYNSYHHYSLSKLGYQKKNTITEAGRKFYEQEGYNKGCQFWLESIANFQI